MTVQIASSHLAALRRWRRLVAAHPRERAGFAAVTFSSLTPPCGGLVPLESANAEVLSVHKDAYAFPLRYAIFSVSRIPFGVSWGTLENNRICKNLRLRPRRMGPGNRFNMRDLRMMHRALTLFETILNGESHAIVDHLQLPRIWAASDPQFIPEASGPEMIGEMHLRGMSSAQVMMHSRRLHDGFALYPADFVDDLVETAPLYVDLDSAPRVQVFRHDSPEKPLSGFRGSAMFDFEECAFQCGWHPATQRNHHE